MILKSCPVCGSHVSVEYDRTGDQCSYWVECAGYVPEPPKDGSIIEVCQYSSMAVVFFITSSEQWEDTCDVARRRAIELHNAQSV